MRKKSYTVFGLFAIVAALGVDLFGQKTLSYSGYSISTSSPAGKNHSVVTIQRGRTILAEHKEGLWGKVGSTVELRSVLGKRTKQLIVSQYTGGNHCCSLVWIYDLRPKFQLLFRSTDFETIGYNDSREMFQNLDKDREPEILDETPAFHYFDDLAYVSSPRPTLVFDYDKKIGRFQLANRKFRSLLLGDAREWISRANHVKDSDPSQFSVWMFSIFLNYVYAGQEKKGMDFYYKNSDLLRTGQAHEWKQVRSVLRSDAAYRELYPK